MYAHAHIIHNLSICYTTVINDIIFRLISVLLLYHGHGCTYQGKSRVHVIQLIHPVCTMYRLIAYVPTQANSLLRAALKPIRGNLLDLLYRQPCKIQFW